LVIVVKVGKILIAALLTMVWSTVAIAGDVTVNASVDKTEVFENENVRFTIEIVGSASDIPDITLPNLPGFQNYSSGTSQNFSFINGKTQTSKSFNFILIPTRTGKLTIPRMKITIDGKVYATPQFDITVSPGASSSSSARQQSQGSRRQQQSSSRDIKPDDLFISTSVNKDTVYVNQQVTLSFKFYQAEGVDVLQNPDFKPPQKTGFWVEDLPPRSASYKTYKNRRYHVTEIKTALFPTTSGPATIGSAELTLSVREPQIRRNDPFSFFNNNFFGFQNQGRTVPLKSEPITIVALPLPTVGKPADFSGAVGRYNINADVDKTSVEANEPITLKVRISGIGNIKSIAAPPVPELADFRSYQSGDSENITKANYLVGGAKTFEYVFIPKRAGSYVLPAINYSFFDPGAKAYKTVSTQPIQVQVAPAPDRYASQMQNLESNNIDLVAKDIRYLKPDLGRINSTTGTLVALRPIYLALYLIPLIGYFVVVGQKKKQERLQSDQSYRRFKQAKKMATRRLSQAEKLMHSGDAAGFYSEINRSIIEYFGDRFNLPSFGLTADKIREFSDGKLDEGLTIRLLDLLRQCDFGRFAPGGAEPDQMKQLWQDAANLIVEMEKSR
jgi:hypothetical protein